MPLAVKMPDGTTQYFNDINTALDTALKSGGTPLDPSGKAAQVTQPFGQGGGYLVNGAPLNVALQQGWQSGVNPTTGQVANQQDVLNQMYGPGYAEGVYKAWNPAPPGTGAPNSGGYPPNTDEGQPPANPWVDPEWALANAKQLQTLGGTAAPTIGNITLPQTPQISQTFSPAVNEDWKQLMGWGQAQIPLAYEGLTTPAMNPAAMNLANVPATMAQTPEQNSALGFLLTGQGYDPATMARMRAGAIDDTAMAGRSNRGSARLAAEQAGLAGSPAALAMESQANRQQGDATTRALNQLEISNAQQGMQNLTTGAGMELGRSTNAAQMMNQSALDNAARLFSGMQQNVANVQQANQQNAGFQQEQNMAKAGAQSGLVGNLTNTYNQALLGKAASAEGQNVANEINRGLNQAQLARQGDIFNTTTGENRYSQAFAGLLGLISGSNPFAYNISGANLAGAQNPNLGYSNVLQNTGNTLLNTGMPRTT